MTYYKIIGDNTVFSDCSVIQTNSGQWISNPNIEQIHAAGWQEYIPPVVPPTPETEPQYDELIAAVKCMLDSQVEELSDEDAIAVAALFPTWISKMGEQVHTGKRYWYDGKLWKVIQDHIVQEDWTPSTAVSLYTEVTIEEWPEWVQPLGSHDAYMTDDKVTHNNAHWQSNIDFNVYEPGVYGWREV